MRHAFRKDAVHADIARTLRDLGCTVVALNDANVPDLLVGKDGRTYLLEVKSPKGPAVKKGKLKPGQAAFIRDWKGTPVSVVYTPEDAINAVLGRGWKILETGDEP